MRVEIEAEECEDVDSLVIGYRMDGELHVLAEREPPAQASVWGEIDG